MADRRDRIPARVVLLALVVLFVGRVTHARSPEGLDVIFVVDVSESAAGPSGVDVDRDGQRATPPKLLGLGGVEDPDDSVLALQLKVARDAVDRLSSPTTRMGVVTAAGDSDPQTPDAQTVMPLTAYAPSVQQALDALAFNAADGLRRLDDALELARRELARSRPTVRKVIVVLSDGIPGSEQLTLRQERVLKKAYDLGQSGVRVDSYGMKAIEREYDWSYFEEIAGHGRGYFARLPAPETVASNVASDEMFEARLAPSLIASVQDKERPLGCPETARFHPTSPLRSPSALMIAIDTSGSTEFPSGIDVDGDGFSEAVTQDEQGIWRGRTSDKNDSVISLEIQIVCSLLSHPALTETRVGLVTFSAPFNVHDGKIRGSRERHGRVVAPLGSNRRALDSALTRIARLGSSGATDLGAPVVLALRELLDGDRPIEGSTILLLTDGRPSAPAGLASVVDPEDLEAAFNAAKLARSAGVPIHVLVVGLWSADNEEFADEFSRAAGGRFHTIRESDDVAEALAHLLQ